MTMAIRSLRGAVLALAATLWLGSVGEAQGNPGGGNGFGRFGGGSDCADPPIKNIPYDGQFTFVRLKHQGGPGQCYYRGEPSWAHGYGLSLIHISEPTRLLSIS